MSKLDTHVILAEGLAADIPDLSDPILLALYPIGAIYSATDTGIIYRRDEDDTWHAWATVSASLPDPTGHADGEVLQIVSEAYVLDTDPGGGSFDEDLLPWLIDIPTYMTPASQSHWDVLDLNTNYWAAALRYSDGTQNAEITWPVVLAAGTWTVELTHTKANDAGIYTVYFDASSVGTIDGYNGSTVFNALDSITGITVASSSKKTLKLKMATKNGSSSSYVGRVPLVRLLRTA